MTVAGPYRKEYEYIGLSADTKPTKHINVGSSFYETDTGLTYIWNSQAWCVEEVATYNRVWSTSSLSWVVMTQPGGGTGGTVDQGIGGASPWLVTGPLTDTQLRNTAVPVSGPLTDTQLRLTAVPISVISLPLPTNAAQDGTDITTPSPAMPAGGVGIRGWLSAIWTKLNGTVGVTGTFWPTTQPVSDDPFSKYKCSDIAEAATSYYGFIDADENWFIIQVTSTTIRFCKGVTDYTTNWTGRAGLTYGYYNVVF